MFQSIINFIVDSGFVGWTIIATGLFSGAIIFERIKTLYIDYGLNINAFTEKISALVAQKKFDEAILVCNKLDKKPLARAFKMVLEKADRDEGSIYQSSDIAMAENVPLFQKRIHYLSMLANVATLLGLLGTIHGLILSFAAVATADPSQKQALLAHGISVSMYTTALGLAVAIPVMIFYSFIVSRQNFLIESMTERMQKLVEMLASSGVPDLSRENIFPDSVNIDQMPPAGNVRSA